MSDLEKVEKLAESYGYKGVDTSKVSSYGGSPTPKNAADAFAMVEIQDLSVEKLVVSPTIFSQMKDSSDWSDVFQDFDSDENKVDMWGAYIESDEEVPDNLMLALPHKDYKDTALLGASVWDPNVDDDKGTDNDNDNDNDEEDSVLDSKSESYSEMTDLLRDMMS